MSYINTIGIATPPNMALQMEIYDYMASHIDYSEKEKKMLKYLYRRSGIEQRYSVLKDFNAKNGEAKFYTKENGYNPRVEERLARYDNQAYTLAIEAIKDTLVNNSVESSQITHIITVSCTGMSAPGMDTFIIQELKIDSGVQRFNVNFMGCYAALNGLRIADTICKADPEAKVLMVCVELCTLHFQNLNSADYNLSNMLFADGGAATIITSQPLNAQALCVHGFVSDINNKGETDMSWNISSSGFLMKLSSYVPQLLSLGFKDLIENILSKYGASISDLYKWAIHPGGKRILDNIEKEFELNNGELNASRKVLKSYGNMSSPTILFVLKELQEDLNENKGKYIFAAAFGPGLTTETALLSYAG